MKHNRFFYVSFSLVFICLAMFAFGCMYGSYQLPPYDELSPASDYYHSSHDDHDSARRIALLQEELNKARLENRHLHNQLAEFEGSRGSGIAAESIRMEYNDALRLFHQRK
jgi:sensor histidine kinase YesM